MKQKSLVWLILSHVAAFLLGAVVLYIFLWWQVLGRLDAAWCQIYTGTLSVERSRHCEKIQD